MLALSHPVFVSTVPVMVAVLPRPPTSVAVAWKALVCRLTLPETRATDCMLFQAITPDKAPPSCNTMCQLSPGQPPCADESKAKTLPGGSCWACSCTSGDGCCVVVGV